MSVCFWASSVLRSPEQVAFLALALRKLEFLAKGQDFTDFQISFEKPLTCYDSGCWTSETHEGSSHFRTSSLVRQLLDMCNVKASGLFRSRKKESLEGRRWCPAVFKDRDPPLSVQVQHISVAFSRPPVFVILKAWVYMLEPLRPVANSVGSWIRVIFSRGLQMGNLLHASWWLRRAHLFSNFRCHVGPVGPISIWIFLESATPNFYFFWGFLGVCLCFQRWNWASPSLGLLGPPPPFAITAQPLGT